VAYNSRQNLLAVELLAQGDARISASADWFKQGGTGMSQALGAERASAIALGIPD
jgi:hypothetical protein